MLKNKSTSSSKTILAFVGMPGAGKAKLLNICLIRVLNHCGLEILQKKQLKKRDFEITTETKKYSEKK